MQSTITDSPITVYCVEIAPVLVSMHQKFLLFNLIKKHPTS